METTYFGLFAKFTTYILLISLKNTTFLLLLSSNVRKVAEFWTLGVPVPVPFLGDVLVVVASVAVVIVVCTDIVALEVAVVVCIVFVVLEVAVVVGIVGVKEQGRGCPKKMVFYGKMAISTLKLIQNAKVGGVVENSGYLLPNGH